MNLCISSINYALGLYLINPVKAFVNKKRLINLTLICKIQGLNLPHFSKGNTEKRGKCRSPAKTLISRRSGEPLRKPPSLLWGLLVPTDQMPRTEGYAIINTRLNFRHKDVSVYSSLKMIVSGSSLMF